MILKKKKKEINLTTSRKFKKRRQKVFSVKILSSNLYIKSLKYNLLKYFLIRCKIKLNRKIFHELYKEEIGFVFFFSN